MIGKFVAHSAVAVNTVIMRANRANAYNDYVWE